MKSIKPGRGPSMMGGISSVAAVLFGVIWTFLAAGSGGGVFALFGLVFIFLAISSAVYNFKNATGENRYSEYDICDANEEPDPFNRYFQSENSEKETINSFCPYCGNAIEGDFVYCNKCGKKLPQ